MRITVATAVACLLAGMSIADETHAAIKEDTIIPAQGLGPALKQLANDRDIQLVYRSELVGDKQTNGAVGELTFDQALTKLLSGTGLTYQYLDDRAVTIVQMDSRSSTQASGPSTQTSSNGVWERFRLAQANAPAGTTSSRDEDSLRRTSLEEIIVTATKRGEESVQDVPMSIAVIGNQDIERRGVIGMEDYLRSIPGVNEIDTGTESNGIAIRGLSTGPASENSGAGRTVATYFGETPITGGAGTSWAGPDIRPVDIERIEVLRGPQGTTYGSSSIGGALRIIPNKPDLDEFAAKAVASYSVTEGEGSDNSMIQGIANLPIVADKFGLRAVGYRYDQSGFYRNIAGIDPDLLAQAESAGLGDFVRGYVQDDVGRMVSTGGRLAALWQVTDNLDVSLNFLTQKVEQDGLPLATVGNYEQARMPVAPQAQVRGEVGEAIDTKMDVGNIVLNYDLGWAESTSAFSWIDGSSAGAVFVFLPFVPSTTIDPSNFRSFTAETRLASHLDGRFQFLAGLFYEDVNTDFVQTIDWPGTPETNPVVISPMSFGDVSRTIDQRAVFGEISYDLTDKLTATLGGRYFKYERSEVRLDEGGFAGLPLGTGVPRFLETGANDSNFKGSLSYEPTDDLLFYASWAEGFRLGQPAPGLPPVTCDRNGDGLVDGTNITIESTKEIDSDSAESYEIGAKLALFNRRMTIDTAIYHINWNKLPLRTVAPAPCSAAFTENAGAAESDGAEFQASLIVIDGLRLDFGAGYTDAKLTEDAPGLLPPAFDGDPLPGSPKVSANLSAQYDFDLAGYRAFIRADSFYAGKFYADLQQTAALGDYIKVDARGGVTIKDFSVELFVQNLTNEDAFTWGFPTIDTPFLGYQLRPRTVGIQLGYSFQ